MIKSQARRTKERTSERTTKSCNAKSSDETIRGKHVVILGKVHVHSSGNHTVIPSVSPVAPVVGKPSLNVVNHTTKQSNFPPFGLPLSRSRSLARSLSR